MSTEQIFQWVNWHAYQGKIKYLPAEASVSSGSGTNSSTKHPDCVIPGSESFLEGQKVHKKKYSILLITELLISFQKFE